MESCAIINWKERENNGRRRECFQTSDDLPWKTLLWWKVNAACDLDSRVATTEKDHGEEKDAEQERNGMTIINEHTISSSTSMRIESPPSRPPNTFCLLPFTSYPVSLEFHQSFL